MTGVVLAEVVALVIVGFFAVGLLHSYAGLLRRVERYEPRAPVAGPRPATTVAPPTHGDQTGADIVGESLDGEPVSLAVAGVAHGTLLAFLSSGCTTCGAFWSDLTRAAGLTAGGGPRLVVVARGPDQESITALRAVAAPTVVETVLSSQSWQDYRVPGSPYFVFVDGPSGLVRGEGTALGWDEVFNLMALATGDSVLAPVELRRPRKPASDAEREAAVDRELMRAGILPGDPSLYPTTRTSAPGTDA